MIRSLGQLPPGIPLEEADGNYVVIDLGGGNFAFYAHMIKGSVAVEVGDFVTRGQVIGLVGNTGNTSAPHLHFHMIPRTNDDGLGYRWQAGAYEGDRATKLAAAYQAALAEPA